MFNITEEQEAEFIHESNAIEEIFHDKEVVLKAVKKGSSNIPEIQGQLAALGTIMFEWEKKKKITVRDVCELHFMVMAELLEPHHLGLRNGWVRIGEHLCPPPVAVKPMLEKWCEKINSFKKPTENNILDAHYAFEKIHPFIDGNGRTGRMLWLWSRYRHGLRYKCIKNDAKHTEYYAPISAFSWDMWSRK